MSNQYILIDLDKEQKAIVLEKASFFVEDSETNKDLNNSRKKWIRFERMSLPLVIGELSYHYNRSNNQYESMLLDEVIMHLEYYEKNTG